MAAKKPTKKNNSGKSKAKAAPQESIFHKFRKEMWGVVCLLLALVILLSNFDRTSIIGSIFSGLFGQAGLVALPIGLILCFITLMFHGNRPTTMRLVCSLSFVLVICAISHLARNASEATWGLPMLGKLYQEGKDGASGGVFGGLLAMTFSLLGGRFVAWALCIVLLVITLPSSLNLTLTGLLRAINNRREQKAKERPADYEDTYVEPAERLVEHVSQRHEEFAQWRQERKSRSRFDYDLPVDDPPEAEAEPPKKQKRRRKAEPVPEPEQLPIPEPQPEQPKVPEAPKPTIRLQQFVFDESDYDQPLPEPVLPDEPPIQRPAREPVPETPPAARPAAKVTACCSAMPTSKNRSG